MTGCYLKIRVSFLPAPLFGVEGDSPVRSRGVRARLILDGHPVAVVHVLRVGRGEHLSLAGVVDRRAIGRHVGLGQERDGSRGRRVGRHVHRCGHVGDWGHAGRAHVRGLAANPAKSGCEARVSSHPVLLALDLPLLWGEACPGRAGCERTGDAGRREARV